VITGENALPMDIPWEAVEYYYKQIYQLWKGFITNNAINGFGRLYESVIHHEFQL